MLQARRSRSSRYSGKVSQFQSIPSLNAAPGMSSTPSINWMSQSSVPGRTGANPTPQLPVTMVVTPWETDGSRTGSHVTWPS